jgi:hypothetical protein
MAGESRVGTKLSTDAGTVKGAARPRWTSEAGSDLALLVCALFLQRFSLSFGNSLMSLDIVPAVFIMVHQFTSGRLLIQYNRLLWFIAAGLAVTYSLWLNFRSTMLPSYCLLIVTYSLFTLIRPYSKDRYKRTLQGFQFLVALLSFLAVAQFVAQFLVDGRELIRFYGIFPDFLFTNRVNTIIPLGEASSLIKSNGIFLTEPSTMSQIAALGILIEIIEFQRPRILLLLSLGLLLSYSGTGLLLLLVFLPLAGLGRKAGPPVLLFVLFAFGLIITGIIDASAFLSRLGEFENTDASGFQRFVSPFWLAADHLDTASVRELLLGNGPGTTDDFVAAHYDRYAGSSGTWFKLFYEYGLIGSFVFTCFFASCFRKTTCPRLLVVAMVFYYIVLGGLLLNTPFLIIMIVLCTLHGSESQRGRLDQTSRYRPPLVAGTGAS